MTADATAPDDTPFPDYRTAKQEAVGDFEKDYLAALLARANGNITEAARIADVDRTTIYRLMECHGLSAKISL